MSVLVLREKPEEFPPGVIRVENRGAIVAPPKAVMSGSEAYQSRAGEARHAATVSKRWAVSRPWKATSGVRSEVRVRAARQVRVRHWGRALGSALESGPGQRSALEPGDAARPSRGRVPKTTSHSGVETP
jgi:hypothetical protein